MAKYCMKCGARNVNESTICSCCGMLLESKSVEKPMKESLTGNKTFSNDHREFRQLGQNGVGNNSFDSEGMDNFDVGKIMQTNQLTEKGLLHEIACNNDFIYVFDDDLIFSSTEYKVINSVSNSMLLKCKKMKYNGKDAIYYMTDRLKPFDIILPTLNSMQFLFILESLFNQINVVKGNGFLSDIGIDVRIKRVYVDMKDGSVYLTYVPANHRCYLDTMYLEQNLRMDLAYIIESMQGIQSPELLEIGQMLKEEISSFGNLLLTIRQKRSFMNGL